MALTTMKTNIHLHQTHHSLADFEGIFTSLAQLCQAPGLHLFSETFLAGYPLKDLVLQSSFIEAYTKHLEEINLWLKGLPKHNWRALSGGLEYQEHQIKNVIYELIPGEGLKKIYTKRLLPNYDIFDEQKYFTNSEENFFYEYNNQIFGLLICEDMWASSFYKIDPCQLMIEEMKAKKIEVDGIINLSASPFDLDKDEKRKSRAQSLSKLFKAPFIYLNRVGGEDEIVFDGSSFVVNNDQTIIELAAFTAESKSFTLPEKLDQYDSYESKKQILWEELFLPQLSFEKKLPLIKRWTEKDCERAFNALAFGLHEYAHKSGFKNFLVALSGGLDSALVLAIVKLALKKDQSVEAIYMPSIHSSSLSTQLCEKMCRDNDIPLKHLPIKFLHSTVKNTFTQTFEEDFGGLTDENVQARLRGMLLYTRSNQTGAMVINTSNKSELAVGYSTQYGDSVGAISLLGDLYKSEVFWLANYLNKISPGIIPEEIINRGPSAELRPNQLDQDSLPPYEKLDAILEGILSYKMSRDQLIIKGFDTSEVDRVIKLFTRSEYKRAQFCPIIKIKAKSFGFGYRVPINKCSNFYF